MVSKLRAAALQRDFVDSGRRESGLYRASPIIDASARDLSRDYLVLRELGRGGTSQVLLARHREIGEEVAIKVFDPSLSDSLMGRKLFLREGRLLEYLGGVATPELIDSGFWKKDPAWVIERFDGEGLTSRLRRAHSSRNSSLYDTPPPFDLSVALDTSIELVRSLRELHQQRVVHRDIKPDNIYFRREYPIFIDLAGAVLVGGGRTFVEEMGGMSSFGTVGFVSGTVEANAANDRQDRDVLAMGVSIFLVLCGEKPSRASIFNPFDKKMTYPSARLLQQGRVTRDDPRFSQLEALDILLRRSFAPRAEQEGEREERSSGFQKITRYRDGVEMCADMEALLGLSATNERIQR